MKEIKIDYTRDDLLKICEQAFVSQNQWFNRDSAEAQKQLGWCYAWLKDGCDFKILTTGNLITNDKTIWLEIQAEGFSFHDYGGELDMETFYLPTQQKLDERKGSDWY